MQKTACGRCVPTPHSHAWVKWLAAVSKTVVANVVVNMTTNMVNAIGFGWGVAMFSEMCMYPSGWLTAGQYLE